MRYRCPRCGLKWERDKGVEYCLIYAYFAGMAREESDDYMVMAARILEAVRKWLEGHVNVLTY
ncbi:MAG: hypothetical protein LM590_03055 [Thermofilum sp.]|nr:hypothetical protein [Thermofilum sp.]